VGGGKGNTMEYRNPKPTVDVVIATPRGIVLVRRANPPHGWALPGGFIDEWEPAEVAALLRLSLDDLGAITGTIPPDDVLGLVFAGFCIGK
jgi:hypothetical protein